MIKRTTATFVLSALVTFASVLAVFGSARSALAVQKKTTPRLQKKITAPMSASLYACPMHPEVKSKKRSRCPKCGMFLTEVSDDTDSSTPQGSSTTDAPAKGLGDLGSPLRIPDATVYDQDGRKLNFYTDLVQGKTVVINYIFTTCTTVCPPITATLRKVQQDLGERVGRDVQMISVSVDPTTDVPERLKSFAEKFKAGPGWTFVTGSKPEIDALLKALGASAPDKNSHTPLIMVGNDRTQYWTRVHGLTPSSTLVKVITEAAAKTRPTPSSGANTASEETSKVTQEKHAHNTDVQQVPMPGAKVGSAATPERRVERGAPRGAAASSPSDAKDSKPKSLAETSASYFPNLVLLTQDNKPVRFYDDLLKGKVILINFMFTTCNGICPPMTANMAKVQKYLGDRVGKEVVMISISVDPTTDTPEALKKYTEKFKVQPGWYFLTGKKEDVDWVLYKLGGYVEDKLKHSGILIIGNEASGEWMKTFAMTNPTEIASAVTKLIESKGQESKGQ